MRGNGHRGGALRAGLFAALAAAAMLLVGNAPAEAATKLGVAKLAGDGKQWKLLVPMSLPLEASGRKVTGRINADLPNRRWVRRWNARVHSGPARLADRRSGFRYVAGIPVSKGLARVLLRQGARSATSLSVRFRAPGAEPEVVRGSAAARTQSGIRRAAPGMCETLPRQLFESSGRQTRLIGFPVCGRKLRWRLVRGPGRGRFKAYGKSLKYTKLDGQSGSDEFQLAGYFKGRLAATQRVQIKSGLVAASNVSVVAFGDSVTAGFGYFGATGKQMGITQLDGCRPGATVFNDACSSNSYNRNSSVGARPDYLPDFGLSRNISWAAQWANEYGITNYRNYAVTGSAPSDWLPGGQFNSTLNTIEQQNPDYLLLTMGANPILSDVLFGIDDMGCALESDLFGNFRQCVLDAFSAVDLDSKLNQLYSSLVANTTSQVIVMQYHLSIPASALAYSAVQLEEMGDLLNEVIADEAATVSTSRILVVKPPRFDVGIDMTPLYPAEYSCSFLGYEVDGPSVQATVSQDELELDHPLSFCSGPATGPPWVISGDTGIHPSAAGYSQMAGQIPAPGS